jgi:glutamine synthetase type III
MFKIKVFSNNRKFSNTFKTEIECNEWFLETNKNEVFGKPAYTEIIPEVLEIKDELGEVIQTAVPAHDIVHPSEYTIEVTDITAQVLAEQAQIQAVKDAQTQAGLRLQAFPAEVDTCQDLESLKVVIKQMVQDVAVLLK